MVPHDSKSDLPLIEHTCLFFEDCIDYFPARVVRCQEAAEADFEDGCFDLHPQPLRGVGANFLEFYEYVLVTESDGTQPDLGFLCHIH